MPDEKRVDERVKHFAYVAPRKPDADGDTEVLDGVTFTHHFVDAPGDAETIRWHYTEAGSGEPIVFLHGIPDSWYQWHHQMATLSKTHRCIGVDLKGYGQSEKGAGDYRHSGAGEQLLVMLKQIGLDKFNVVTHDRGTVQADFIVADHPESVLRYARGEQHLYHFHPSLAPQGDIFMNAPYTGIMEDPKHFAVWLYTWITKLPVPLIVPSVTLASIIFSTGVGSPLTIDSSTELLPSRTTPSVGIFSPGRTRRVSPTWIAFKSTSCSEPFVETRRAVFGASPRSALIAPLAWLRAFSSRTWPSRTSTVMTAAASK